MSMMNRMVIWHRRQKTCDKTTSFFTRFFLATVLALLALGVEGSAQTKTKVIDNGADSGKKIIAVLGDGYTQAEQSQYNTHVDNMITSGVFANDFFREQHNAFNVYRVNLISAESGVSQKVYDEQGTPKDPSDDTVTSTTMKNTALKYIYSGSWAHCWMEQSSQTETLLQNALSAVEIAPDYIVIILNESGGGGCGGNDGSGHGRLVVTSGGSWKTVAHEMGHGIGGLFDEYSGAGAYTGGYLNSKNCSTELNKASVYWNRFISPTTWVPTALQTGMDSNRTVGLFEGCKTKDTGIYRPVHNCRMRGNTPNFCPVCQTLMRKSLYPYLKHDFDDAVVGDFNGDGKADVLVHNGNDVAIYESSPDTSSHKLDLVWIANNVIPSAPGSSYFWTQASGDKYYVADFNNDGKDDVYVFNGTSWSQPWLGLLRSNGTGLETVVHYGNTIGGYWTMKSGDRHYVGDFNGDGKDDLYIFNGTSWTQPYILMAQSTGAALSYAVRYDGTIPGWIMASGDRHYVGDFNGDGKDDLYIFNGTSWSNKYLGMLKSFGSSLSDIMLYTNTLASGWNMGTLDQHYVGDIDGDGKDDLYVFNGQNWSYAYMELTKSTGTALNYVKRYDNDPGSSAGNIPGWSLSKGDRFYVYNVGWDLRSDLVVFNTSSWSSEYIGKLVSSGTALSGSWSVDSVGGWNLDPSDKILVGRYSDDGVKPDIFIRNTEWFGLLRSESSGFSMDRIYFHWLYTPLYDTKPWSDSLP